MRKQEKKNLLKKFTVFTGKKLEYKNRIEGWTDKEMSEACGIAQTRLTEIKNFQKYQRLITETYLAAFIGGGIVTIKEIEKGVDLNESERKYIGTLLFYENQHLIKDVSKAMDDGIDVQALIRAERERLSKK